MDKIQRAQDAGAIAVVMVNNVPGDPIIMGGDTSTIVIPAIISGDMKKPNFKPDAKTFLQLQTQRLLPNLIDAISGKKTGEEPKPGGLLGSVSGHNTRCCASPVRMIRRPPVCFDSCNGAVLAGRNGD